MIWIAAIGSGISGIVLSVVLCVYGSKQPLTIKFSYSPIDWFIPVFTTLPWVLTAFVIEYIISAFVNPIEAERGSVLYFLKKAYENGVFIPLLCVAVSWLFYISVKSLHLQYHPLYSDKVPKVCFTVIVLSFCAVLLVDMAPKYLAEGPEYGLEYDFMVNRILMWLFTVVGTWIGFGFGCKSKEEKDNKFICEDNEGITVKDKLKFWAPIIAALIVCDIVMVTYTFGWLELLTAILFSFAFMFVLSGVIVLSITKNKKNPSISKSKKNFIKAKNSHKQSGYGEGQFGELKYCLDKDKLIIKERNVIYEGHQKDEEFMNLFGEEPIPLEESEDKYEKAWKALDKRLEDQENYIKKELNACLKAASENKREKFR